MAAPSLFSSGRTISTPFGLLGNDEDALSFALGYTFRECPRLLQRFLSDIGVPGIRVATLARARIDLQKHGAATGHKGITDIEIRLPGVFHVIIETKIGQSVPTIEQCSKYVLRLEDTNEPNQKLVALVGSADNTLAERYATQEPSLHDRLVAYNWVSFFPHCLRLMRNDDHSPAGMSVRWFYSFLDREYHMKAFTTEVWIVPASTKRLSPDGCSLFDTHLLRKVFWDARPQPVRPLYIAFRANAEVKEIHRVLSIEHDTPPIKYVPELKEMEETSKWREPMTIWHLDEPVPLPNPIPTGPGLFQRSVRCDMDILLSSRSVKEIEDKMKARREEGD